MGSSIRFFDENDFLVGKRVIVEYGKKYITFKIEQDLGHFVENGKDIKGVVVVPRIYTITKGDDYKIECILCEDVDDVLRFCTFNLCDGTPTLSKKTKRAIVSCVIDRYKRDSNVFYYHPRKTHYNILQRDSNFFGTLVDLDGTKSEVVLPIIDEFVDPKNVDMFVNEKENNVLKIKDYGKYGSLCWDMTNGKFVLEYKSSHYKDYDNMNLETNVCFVKKTSLSILKKANINRPNVRMRTNRYKRVDGQIKDMESGVCYTQKEFLNGEHNKNEINIVTLKKLIDDLTNELAKNTSNVYCCAKLVQKTKDNGFRQMYSHYEVEIPGFLIDFGENTIESGLKKRERVMYNLHSDGIEYENNIIDLSTLSTIAPLKKLGFDYIKVYQSDNEHIVKNGKTLYVYLKLNSSLLDNYNHFYTKSRTNWSTMSMADLWC